MMWKVTKVVPSVEDDVLVGKFPFLEDALQSVEIVREMCSPRLGEEPCFIQSTHFERDYYSFDVMADDGNRVCQVDIARV